MIERLTRCTHCGDVYSYQASGDGCNRNENDPHYCPVCKTTINDALSQIPPKRVPRDVFTNEVTLETLQMWEKNKTRSKGFPAFHRIIPGGIRQIKDGSFEYETVQEVVGQEDKKGRIYKYRYWKDKDGKRISEPKITVRMEIHKPTGTTTGYWKKY